MSLAALNSVPQPVVAAGDLIAAIDGCFVSGFARLGGPQRDALMSISRTFQGTPLAAVVAEAAAVAAGGPAGEAHLMALAAAREALAGARYDALLAQATDALGGAIAVPDTRSLDLASASAEDTVTNLMAGTRQWLLELALAGFAQLEIQTVAPFAATLEKLQEQPALGRLAALLTGLMDEIMDSAPTSGMDQVPARRWADLWCRAMLGAHRLPPAPASTEVSGTLRMLGADARHHDHIVSLIGYGLLEVEGEKVRMVRTQVSCWKVDAITSDEVWTTLEGAAGDLLTALAGRKSLTITGMPLSATGELIWRGKTRAGKVFDPIDAALEALGPGAGCPVPVVLPLDRHPVQLAVPVAVEKLAVKMTNGEPGVDLDGATLPLAPLSPLLGLDIDALGKSAQAFGLLRFDRGRWTFQPLVTRTGKKAYFGAGEAIGRRRKVGKQSGTLAVLKERAGKLLRK